jgi:glycogen operon protein
LSTVKLIAEPWDVGFGGYELGDFPPGWSEWNGRYRDTVRDFWRSADGMLPEFATRLTGSSDLYGRGRRPTASINLVTVHDGFTLADLVSYNQKHNEANGENNRDGADDNRSWNCGVEGPTDDPGVRALRVQQRRNFLITLLVSEGVPLLLGGDELGRTQQGNNNAYCQDNDTSWVDWSLAGRPDDLTDFVAELCRLRLRIPVLHRSRFFREDEIAWLRPDGQPMTPADWSVPYARAITVCAPQGTYVLMANSWWEPLTFRLPDFARDERLAVVVDTSAVHAPGVAIQGEVSLSGRSLMMLERAQTQSA